MVMSLATHLCWLGGEHLWGVQLVMENPLKSSRQLNREGFLSQPLLWLFPVLQYCITHFLSILLWGYRSINQSVLALWVF